MRSAALSTIIAAIALTSAACSSTQPGQPSPAGSLAPSSASPSSAATAASKLSGVNACALLADSEAQQIAPGAGSHTDYGDAGGAGTSVCGWTKPVVNGQGGVSFGIVVRPAQSINDLAVKPGGQLSRPTSTGGRQVALVKNNEGKGTCLAAIAVGSGRIDINATTMHDTTEQMCSVVSKIDDFVEARLPSS
ncbi:DUF3558 family protein [Amycolatopsis cynarae]|uniref:DUF3558 family protein n=1 Tax=Amycolatopsis cynarae TaxID=2995223 RepID=A0ABY7B294_9PSEU|nr:DUF3558 family protein [Amycolatopsis sp. HUAS 11-8]WAL65808.1 DUF3558 family protein [Amycolatopsis sp. HUAS 11-8]